MIRCANLSNVKVIQKAENQTHLNDATLRDDADFNITLKPNRQYHIQLFLLVDGNADADLKTAWIKGAGITATQLMSLGPAASGTNMEATTSSFASSPITEAFSYGYYISYPSLIMQSFKVTTGNTGNTLKLQHCQLVSTNNTTTIFADSYMIITEISNYQ